MISITEKAAKKIQTLLAEKGLDAATHGLRISIAGGGCSGYMYQMDLTERREGDNVYPAEDAPAKVLVDPKSALLLGGSTVDYSDGLTDAGFKVLNPHAKDSCGCGLSFSV